MAGSLPTGLSVLTSHPAVNSHMGRRQLQRPSKSMDSELSCLQYSIGNGTGTAGPLSSLEELGRIWVFPVFCVAVLLWSSLLGHCFFQCSSFLYPWITISPPILQLFIYKVIHTQRKAWIHHLSVETILNLCVFKGPNWQPHLIFVLYGGSGVVLGLQTSNNMSVVLWLCWEQQYSKKVTKGRKVNDKNSFLSWEC